MKPRVVVVGSFVQDLCFACDAFPAAGATTLGTFVSGPGGKGSNQAVAAARAGAAVTFVGAVGADAFAAGAKAFHRAEGIRSHLVPKPPHATAAAGILVDRTGQNEIVVALGASARLRPTDVPADRLRGAGIVVCQHEANLAVNAHVFRLARRLRVTTVLNPAPMRADFDPAILRHVDILIPNETELAALAAAIPGCATWLRRTGHGTAARRFDAAALHRLSADELHVLCRAIGVPVVIVTLGARGCFVSQPDGHTRLPAHRVKAVDTTGAGDAFIGGFAAGFIESGGDVLASARLGSAVAALSVTKRGTARSMPARREVEAFLRKRR